MSLPSTLALLLTYAQVPRLSLVDSFGGRSIADLPAISIGRAESILKSRPKFRHLHLVVQTTSKLQGAFARRVRVSLGVLMV